MVIRSDTVGVGKPVVDDLSRLKHLQRERRRTKEETQVTYLEGGPKEEGDSGRKRNPKTGVRGEEKEEDRQKGENGAEQDQDREGGPYLRGTRQGLEIGQYRKG